MHTITFYYVSNVAGDVRCVKLMPVVPIVGDTIYFSLVNTNEYFKGEFVVVAREFWFEDALKITVTLKRK